MTADMPVIRVVAAVVLDERGRMLVVRKRRTTAFMQPGGKIDPGESAIEAIRREVAEELGVAASSVRELGRNVADAANEPGHRVEAEVFLVTLAGEPRAAAEIDEIAWLDPADPGDIELAPLTKQLSASHCGGRPPAADSSVMAYLKPPWFVRKIFNRVAMATGVGNSQTLTVTKRVSKQPQHIPVVVPEVGGVKYLVSTRGEAEWVKNVRADPHIKLGDTNYVAREVPVEERAPVIAAYRPLAGKVVEGYWKELPADADHPTFALTPG